MACLRRLEEAERSNWTADADQREDSNARAAPLRANVPSIPKTLSLRSRIVKRGFAWLK